MLKKLNFVIISIIVVLFAGANLSAQVPSIVSVSPADNVLGAASSSNITVTFDIDMDGSSFSSTTFIVSGSYTGIYQGAYSYDSPSKTVTFDPNTDFATGEVVSIILTTAVQSSISTPLGTSYGWTFVSDVGSTVSGFDTAAVYTVGSMPHGLTSADLDNDGLPDVASALAGANQVSVLINDGAGGFNSTVKYSVGAGV
ncbi:MAG: Ig-like domain-containing protein, partial [candidate division Zixibacteria bacterium]